MAEPGAVEIITVSPTPDPEQAKAQQFREFLSKTREVLSADQLVSMIAPRARFESQPTQHFYFFTIDGVLNGRKVVGALFAGEPMLVRATTMSAAQEQANQGLRYTIDLIHKEFNSRPSRVSPVEEGLVHESSGRRGKEGDGLRRLPKMRAMLEHIIGGKPWQW